VKKAKALLLILLAAAAIAAAAAWEQVTGAPELSFPRDHGAHPGYRSEWWYATGILYSTAGERYGYQLTFFRQCLDAGPIRPGHSHLRARQVLAAHLAVIDIGRGEHHLAQRLRRVGAGLAGFGENDLQVWLEDWELRRSGVVEGGILVLVASDRAAGIGVELTLAPVSGPILHGEGGYSQKGAEPGNASVYVSWTRLATTGELTLASRQLQVTGESWFDHEWGTSQLGEGVAGWDWFGLRLDSQRELMVYHLRRHDGRIDPRSAGTLVEGNGEVVHHLASGDIVLHELDSWTSPASSATYPIAWRLQVPGHDIDLTVRALVADAELDTRQSTGTIYWEGPVEVTGTSHGQGYAELTGYTGQLAALRAQSPVAQEE
jgi:predicted secreted hydrolase